MPKSRPAGRSNTGVLAAPRGIASRGSAAPVVTPRARELAQLWRRYGARRDEGLRNELVGRYQDLVAEIVRLFSLRLPRNVDRGDLETAANVGLMAAIEGFDSTRGIPFEIYCELRVRGALLDELRNLDWLPRLWRKRVELQRRAVERLRTELGAEPSDAEIAAALEMPVDEYARVFSQGIFDEPLTATASNGGGSGQLADLLSVVPDPESESAGDRLSRTELLRLVTQRLTLQEYRLVYLRYWEDLSMREIGDLMSLSESRVSKLHLQLLERLKDRFGVVQE